MIEDASNSLLTRSKFSPSQEHEQLLEKKSLIPRRYVVCLLTFLGVFNMHALRLNLSVAVVSMTSEYPVTLANGTVIQRKNFNWNSVEKGYILSSFYLGYLISEFPSGLLGSRFGGGTVLVTQVACVAIITLLIPFAVNYGPMVFFACRAMTGLFEGGSLPCVHAIWSRWAPEEERSRLISISINGGAAAKLICFPLYGFMATYWGWQSLFYVPGISAIFWCFLWLLNIKDDPVDDAKITGGELKYIQKTVGKKLLKKKKYPWRFLLTSIDIWAMVLTHFTHCWTKLFLATELPSYFYDVWRMDISQSGLLISAPYISVFSVSLLSGILADYLIYSRGYRVIKVRKWLHSISALGASICLLLVHLSSSSTVATISLMAQCGFNSISYVTIFCSPLDIAPNYASIIMGMMSTGSSLAGVISTTLCGYIVTHQSKDEWFITFIICIALYGVSMVTYLTFGRDKIQSWALNTENQNR